MSNQSFSNILLGGLVGGVFALLSGTAIWYVTSPSSTDGRILYLSHFGDDRGWSLAEKEEEITKFQAIQFYNLKDDVNDFDILIPVNDRIPNDVEVKIEPRSAVISQQSSIQEASRDKVFKIKIEHIDSGGAFVIEFTSKQNVSFLSDRNIGSSSKDVKIFHPGEAYRYMD